ncbi:hypothetical protein EMCRGX_G008934 [Ephydatia muelleri]
MKGKTTVDEMQQVIGIEQFLNSFPLEKRLWLVEKKQGSCVAAGELVDEFEQTRQDCRGKKEDVGGRSSGPSMLRCYQCRQIGHIVRKEVEQYLTARWNVVADRESGSTTAARRENPAKGKGEFVSGSKLHDLGLEEVKATVDGTGPKKGAGDPSCGLGHPVSVEELKTLQKQNETLAEVWRAAEKALEQNETGYFKEDGVLYRKWVPTD